MFAVAGVFAQLAFEVGQFFFELGAFGGAHGLILGHLLCRLLYLVSSFCQRRCHLRPLLKGQRLRVGQQDRCAGQHQKRKCHQQCAPVGGEWHLLWANRCGNRARIFLLDIIDRAVIGTLTELQRGCQALAQAKQAIDALGNPW